MRRYDAHSGEGKYEEVHRPFVTARMTAFKESPQVHQFTLMPQRAEIITKRLRGRRPVSIHYLTNLYVAEFHRYKREKPEETEVPVTF